MLNGGQQWTLGTHDLKNENENSQVALVVGRDLKGRPQNKMYI
jgi:hypothetical protein